MLKSYKYRIYPNPNQIILFEKTFGCCRKIYNWALDFKTKRYSQFRERVGRFELDRIVSFFKKTEEFKYLNDVLAQALQQELLHLDNAFALFFKKKKGYPKFKNKDSNQSFSCPQNVKINFSKNIVYVPKAGNTSCKIDRKFNGKIKTCTISKTKTNKYFISILVEDGNEKPKKKSIKEETSLGVDLGLKSFLVDSNNNVVKNPKFFIGMEQKIKVHQRRLSKKIKGSKNNKKQRIRLAKLQEKVANQRKDFLHKLSTKIIKNHDTIFVEDLNIKGMLKNHHLAKSISDASWSEFFRQLKYKADWYGKNVIEIGRFEPSSKMCSCGSVNTKLTLNIREWTCENCGVLNNRDLLAAQNIKKFGLIKQGCCSGLDKSGESVESVLKRTAVKQKINIY